MEEKLHTISEKITNENMSEYLSRLYSSKKIYKKIGLILISFNPYINLNIYGVDAMKAYYKNYTQVDSHIYSIAENAIQQLYISGNQSILVSGESGSGKTINSEHILRYITWRTHGTKNMEELLISATYIMECFGNAKTNINENSSRFGKFLTLYLRNEVLVGARISQFLLENNRVTHRSCENRNFHIFYMVCADKGIDMQNDYIRTETHSYDKERCAKLKQAIEMFGITNHEHFIQIIIGILKIGSIQFSVIDDKIIVVRDKNFEEVCKIFAIDADILEKTFIRKYVVFGSEVTVMLNSLKRATKIRDSLARNIYSKLFEFIVAILNSRLGETTDNYISILDIFGFEIFQENDFDQFCINWANERIQKEYISRLFEDKREFYRSENVEWPDIDFIKNDGVLEVIEKKYGIADLIDEESYNPCGSIEGLAAKIYKYNNDSKVLANRNNSGKITIKHFSQTVEYSISNFLEKNSEENLEITFSVDIGFPEMKFVFSGDARRSSFIKYFKKSLDDLFKTVDQSDIQFVRCIRPNLQKSPWVYDRNYVENQILSCGLVETIKLSHLTYPHIIEHKKFEERYNVICVSQNIAKQIKKGNNYYFLQENSFKSLETLRSNTIYRNRIRIREFITSRIMQMYEEARETERIITKNIQTALEPPIKATIDVKDVLYHNEVNKDNVINDAMLPAIIRETGPVVITQLAKNEERIYEDLNQKVKMYQKFYSLPCRNCSSIETKYKIQTNVLKKKKNIELEFERMKKENQLLRDKITKQQNLIKKLTISSNGRELPQHHLPENDLHIVFSNTSEIFSCLVDLFITYSPRFTSDDLQRGEALALAHMTYKIITEVSAKLNIDEESCFDQFLFEFNKKIITPGNTHIVVFLLSNLIELELLMSRIGVNVTIGNTIRSYFLLLCDMQKGFLNVYIPDSLVYYEAIDGFRCGNGLYKKLFSRTTSILELVSQVDYLCSMMSYFQLPECFIKESLRYMMKYINFICFNRILVEKRFLKFNRTTQINYNLNEIMKFCTDVGFTEAYIELHHIQDVIKLMNLTKNKQTFETLEHECKSLNLNQIITLISKMDGDCEYLKIPKLDENMTLFLTEPKPYLPKSDDISTYMFCIPSYVPSKFISALLASL